MKKVLAMVAMFLMVPLAAHAKSAITDNEMAAVTGQAGVSINLDVNMNLTMDSAAWGDGDGLGTGSNTTAGWIGMTDFNAQNVKVHARSDYLADPSKLQFLTIDVATADASNTQYASGTTFVRLGLGTMEISADSIAFNVGLGQDGTKAGLNQTLGTVTLAGLDMKIHENSYVDILTNQLAGQTGVTFNSQVQIDSLTASALSWGNSASTYNSGSAGYIGLANLAINNLQLNGQVSFNVATANPTAAFTTPGDTNYWSQVYGQAAIGHALAAGVPAAAANTATLSYVHIGLGDNAGNPFAIHMDSFSSDVKLANNAGLTGALNSSTLGSMYAENVNFNIKGWVDIAAH